MVALQPEKLGASVRDWWGDEYGPSRREKEEWRSFLSVCRAWCKTAWCAIRKSRWLLFSVVRAHASNSPHVLCVFLMEHGALERQGSCISIEGFSIYGF